MRSIEEQYKWFQFSEQVSAFWLAYIGSYTRLLQLMLEEYKNDRSTFSKYNPTFS